MMEAKQAKHVSLSGWPAPFTHQPRPPNDPGEHPQQRHFGEAILLCVGGISVETGVMRWADKPYAQLKTSSSGPLGRNEAQINLRPDELRALARCLIDAAHDLEQGVAS
jgi:hypothetical protein